MDACYSGSLLDLGHYLCQCAPRQRAQCMVPTSTSHLSVSHLHICQAFSASEKKRTEAVRRNTEGVGPFRVPPNPSFLTRKKFKKAITTTVAVIRFKSLLEKKSKEDEDEDEAVPPTSPTVCNRCHRAFDFSKAPEVVCACFPLSCFHVHL